MSPKNHRLHNTGLTALAWLGLAAWGPVVTMSAEPPVGTAAPANRVCVLALTDGRVLTGMVKTDAAGYALTQHGGTMHFRKAQVEGIFGSLPEVYRFKADRVPARDPDEHLKLAHWCLAHRLEAEAKAQLEAVLELSPGSVQIQYMIANIDSALERGRRATRACGGPVVKPPTMEPRPSLIPRSSPSDATPRRGRAGLAHDLRPSPDRRRPPRR